MIIKTRYFGEIELAEDKVITLEHGLMGFEDYKRYTILYDIEDEEEATISWLQSLDEQALALPVINPVHVKQDYNPVVEDELLKSLGDITEENMVILLVLSVPEDLTKMTANLKAPIIINSHNRRGSQIIVENSDYEIKYNVYNVIEKIKSEKGGQ